MAHPGAARGGLCGRARDGFRHEVRVRFRLTLKLVGGQVRVWNIPEQRVVDYADVHEMVTATAFAPDGRRAVVGTMKGRCRFYACEPSFRLEYQAQIGACLLAHHSIKSKP